MGTTNFRNILVVIKERGNNLINELFLPGFHASIMLKGTFWGKERNGEKKVEEPHYPKLQTAKREEGGRKCGPF